MLLRYLNLMIGEEGVGKGNLVAWIGAGVTRGELEGDLLGTPHRFAIIGDEDSFNDIWTPRLEAAGANLDLVLFTESGPNGEIDVRHDAEAIGQYVDRNDIKVLYFDQLLDNLGVVDTWKDKQVRDALAPLRRVVSEHEFAALMTMHPNKRKGSFRDRVSGTPAFNALSRSSLLVAPHPQEPGRRLAVRAKGNYSAEPPAFEFLVEEVFIDNKARGTARALIKTSRIHSIRETGITADEILTARASRERDDSKIGQARLLLTEMLADGEVHAAKDVLDEMLKKYGLSDRIVTAAATKIGVEKWPVGFPARWLWMLPQEGGGKGRPGRRASVESHKS
jgi:hypothetical protein